MSLILSSLIYHKETMLHMQQTVSVHGWAVWRKARPCLGGCGCLEGLGTLCPLTSLKASIQNVAPPGIRSLGLFPCGGRGERALLFPLTRSCFGNKKPHCCSVCSAPYVVLLCRKAEGLVAGCHHHSASHPGPQKPTTGASGTLG